MKEVSLKGKQSFVQSTITWTKKSNKGRMGENACVKVFLPKKELKIPIKIRFASKVVLFQNILAYVLMPLTIDTQQTQILQSRVLNG
jgi:hypothetical protein